MKKTGEIRTHNRVNVVMIPNGIFQRFEDDDYRTFSTSESGDKVSKSDQDCNPRQMATNPLAAASSGLHIPSADRTPPCAYAVHSNGLGLFSVRPPTILAADILSVYLSASNECGITISLLHCGDGEMERVQRRTARCVQENGRSGEVECI
jgi:hypothetical protein